MIPYGKQDISDDDIKSMVDTLKSDFITTGPKVLEFEQAFAKACTAKYAVAVSNGTAALHLACLAAGLGKGDELITTPLTFIADANCALYCNAKPVFADVNEHGLIDPENIRSQVTEKSKIIIPIHYAGMPCDMEPIREIAKEHNLTIIEDACHALGADYDGNLIGSCSHSDMAVFSLHPVKHITTGEGGVITTNNETLYQKLLMLRNHGIERENFEYEPDGPWYYEMQELGYNFRLTDIQCALGLAQMSRLSGFVEKRRAIAARYDEELTGVSPLLPLKLGRATHSYHLYVVCAKDSDERKRLFLYLKEKGIHCQVHYIPVNKQPYYQRLGYGSCPMAEKLYERIISLPMYPGLGNSQDSVLNAIRDFFSV